MGETNYSGGCWSLGPVKKNIQKLSPVCDVMESENRVLDEGETREVVAAAAATAGWSCGLFLKWSDGDRAKDW